MFQYQSLLPPSESASRRIRTVALNIARTARVRYFFGLRPTHGEKEVTKNHAPQSISTAEPDTTLQDYWPQVDVPRLYATTRQVSLMRSIRSHAPTAGVGLANYLRPRLNHPSPGRCQAFIYHQVSRPISEPRGR
jgi:hypothetical protein